MVLAEHADPSGASAFPSWDRIARTVGVSTRTIGSTLSSLQAKGLIRRGDQRIAEAAVRRRGKSRAYAPTVWDLVMDGSHAAATQAHLPPAVDEDRQAAASRLGNANPQLNRYEKLAGLRQEGSSPPDEVDISAGQEPCRSCRSAGACSEACNLTLPRHEVSRPSGVKPPSDEPSTSTKNMNPLPQPTSTQRTLQSALNESNGPRYRGARNQPLRRPAPDGTVAARIRSDLPSRLSSQVLAAPLRKVCVELVACGWTVDQISRAVREHSWDGVGGGAVITWLRDLTLESPPDLHMRNNVRGQSLSDHLRDDYRRDREMAASDDSPARRAARDIAAAAARNARARRVTPDVGTSILGGPGGSPSTRSGVETAEI